jgi:hypothetical protein
MLKWVFCHAGTAFNIESRARIFVYTKKKPNTNFRIGKKHIGIKYFILMDTPRNFQTSK